REEIETAARQFYELLTARNQSLAKLDPSTKQARAAEVDAQCATAGAALSRMLLGPGATYLGNKRLLIVTEGALQYVPFAALPSPRRQAANTPLIVEHEMISLPSASTLAVLRHETAGRKPASKAAAIIADPVFELLDERLKHLAV